MSVTYRAPSELLRLFPRQLFAQECVTVTRHVQGYMVAFLWVCFFCILFSQRFGVVEHLVDR